MCVYMFLYALSTASFVAPHSCSVLPVCVCVPQCPLFDCFTGNSNGSYSG